MTDFTHSENRGYWVCHGCGGKSQFSIQLTLEQSGLNCVGWLICRFFSIVNTAVLQDPWLVESSDVKPWILKNWGFGVTINYTRKCLPHRGSAPPNPCVVQGSTVYIFRIHMIKKKDGYSLPRIHNILSISVILIVLDLYPLKFN